MSPKQFLLRASILCLPAFLSGQTISFLPPVGAFLGGASRGSDLCGSCLAVADFNGDGKMDIVYTGRVLSPIAGILLGNGDGTFRNGVTFATGFFDPTLPVTVGDFNGDGKPDLIFLGNTAKVYLGNGDGTFSGPFNVPGCRNFLNRGDGSADYVSVVSVADLNRDGRQDLICGPLVFLSAGDGSFTAGTTLPADALLAADMNRDGIPDVLMISSQGIFTLALGKGDGTFAAGLAINNPFGFKTPNPGEYYTAVRSADFNNDGFVDLLGASRDGTTLVVLPGRGDGTFGTPVATFGLFDSVVPSQINAMADFNHDGFIGLIAGDGVIAGNGDGTFRFPVFVGVATEPCNIDAAKVDSLACDYSHTASAIGDFNGDGKMDLVSGYVVGSADNNKQASISVMLNSGAGNGFTAAGVSAANWTWPVGPGSLVAAFGVNLATQTAFAPVAATTTTLGGIRVHVRDRSHPGDRLAQLYYVSPTQVNYVLESYDNFAWVTIERVGSPYVAQGMGVPIRYIAAGLFSVGNGVAAATAFRDTAAGRLDMPVTNCVGVNCTSVPINLAGAPVYLSLYGTGFTLASTAGSTCSVAGRTLPAMYVGPQGTIPGLNQINILLPPILGGSGFTSITCSLSLNGVAQPPTNAVKVLIQ